MSDRTYRINEMFYSLQGEGMRAGTANVFVRFSGCNQTCVVESHGFDCDTEFVSGMDMTLQQIHEAAAEAMGTELFFGTANEGIPKWQVLTGGEPGLQVDQEYCAFMHDKGWALAIETNGSIDLPHIGTGQLDDYDLDWITVSPKVAEHAIRQEVAHEVKYVRGHGQGIPKPTCEAQHKLISPAFLGLDADPKAMAWCVDLVAQNPAWRLSVQAHKMWRVR
jgi:organic radical activating enzyme